MNKTKHTPGPWIITQRPFSNARTIRYDGVPVATMNGQSYPLQINENACLVAAAPDLLFAATLGQGFSTDGSTLLEFAAYVLEGKGDPADRDLIDQLRRKAALERDAIAKARGEVTP